MGLWLVWNLFKDLKFVFELQPSGWLGLHHWLRPVAWRRPGETKSNSVEKCKFCLQEDAVTHGTGSSKQQQLEVPILSPGEGSRQPFLGQTFYPTHPPNSFRSIKDQGDFNSSNQIQKVSNIILELLYLCMCSFNHFFYSLSFSIQSSKKRHVSY